MVDGSVLYHKSSMILDLTELTKTMHFTNQALVCRTHTGMTIEINTKPLQAYKIISNFL